MNLNGCLRLNDQFNWNNHLEQLMSDESLECDSDGKAVNDSLVQSKQCLLYLVRMGSFNSNPKIQNDDTQDNNLNLPPNLRHHELIELCQKQTNHIPILKRQFQTVNQSDNFINNQFGLIRVLQWNILSQALGSMTDNFVKCPKQALDWNFRKFRMIEEIVQYNPDIICLQEVDHFNYLNTILNTQGYSGIFYPKPDSPCTHLNGNNGPDGCAIFYRLEKFDLIEIYTHILELWSVESNQVALLLILREKLSGKKFCVTTTHLKARTDNQLLARIRNEQGKNLLKFITTHSNRIPTIICGDFNAEPIEPVYRTILECDTLKLGSAYADWRMKNDGNVKNSMENEPKYTTWKIRDEGEICHTIDYIFYTKNSLKINAILMMANDEEIGVDRLPSLKYSSDHFSLVCDIDFV